MLSQTLRHKKCTKKTELKRKLLEHYDRHKDFMGNKKFARFIEFRLNNEDHQEPWIRALKTLIPDLENKDVLDVGCGDGGFVVAMSKKCRSVRGCDVSEDNIEMARLRGRVRGIDENAFVVNPGRELPYEDESFDVAVMLDVIEHIQEIPPVIEEVWRVLRPGGLFFSSTPNRLWPKEPHVNLLFVHWLPQALRDLLLRRLRGPYAVDLIGTVNYLSSHALSKLLGKCFNRFLLNDQIFMRKLKTGGQEHVTGLRSRIKRLAAQPVLWFLVRPMLRWLWPSVYVLAIK